MPKSQSKNLENTPLRRVIEYSTREFFTKGVRQVTMDDIAKGLQMSKRTLYQLFADKEQLIIACLELLAEQERQLTASLTEKGYNVLEIILRIVEFRLNGIRSVSQEYVEDLKKYTTVKEHVKAKKEDSIKRAVAFLQKGVEQDLFRNDVNFSLVMRSMFHRIEEFTTSQELKKFSISERFINIGLFHIRGCCTPKGVELIDRFLEMYRQQHNTPNTQA